MESFDDDTSYFDVLRRRNLNKLWDVSEELYEVDVFKKNNDVLDTDLDDILNTGGIHCHICNLEVPKMYIKEHNRTATHQNLLKITDEALERTRNYMKNTEISNLTIKVENTYFCEVCSRIVLNFEKELHDKSNFHKKCVNFNNLLSCFVDSYLNINEKKYDLNCNLENVCLTKNYKEQDEILLPEMQQKELLKNLEPQTLQAIHKTENSDSKLELNEKQTQIVTHNEKPKPELLQSLNKSKNEKLEIYFDTIKSKNSNNVYEIEFIPNDEVKITALNQDVIIVPVQNFHSYNINYNRIYCCVCMSEVLEESHKDLEYHIHCIMTPIADKNGIRKINDLSHCIICNELIEDFHNESSIHLSNLKKYYHQFSRSQKVQEENGKNEAENDQKQIKDHRKYWHIDHKHNLTEFNESFIDMDSKIDALFPISKKILDIENNSDKLNSLKIVGQLYEMFVGNLNSIKDRDSKSDVQNLKPETQTESEINLNSIQNDITKPEGKFSHYCSVCQINVFDNNAHKLSESHKRMEKENKRIFQQLKYTNHLLPVKNRNLLTKCGLCNIFVKHDKRLIDIHINTDNHRKNYDKFMEDNKIISINDQECRCEPCNQKILKVNVFEHCSKSLHVNKLKNHINNETLKLIKINFTTNGDNLLCKTCFISIPKKNDAIKKHVDSSEHCIRYNGIIINNKVQINTDSSYCEICSVKIPLGDEFDHIYSISHTENLVIKSKNRILDNNSTETIPSTSEIKKESVPQTQPKNAEQEKTEEIKVPLYVKHHFKKTNKTSAFCIICEKSVPYSEITTHAKSHEHKIKFNVLMCKNGIQIKKGNKKDGQLYRCLICESSVPRCNEAVHVFGKQHVHNYGRKSLSVLTKQAAESGLEYVTFGFISSLPGGNTQVLL